MDYKNMDIHDIIKYCQEQGPEAIAWLKATAAKKVEYKVYPRVKKDGKVVADKTQDPKIELRPISFIQIKTEFLEHFGLAAPKKEKEPTMYDLIANL